MEWWAPENILKWFHGLLGYHDESLSVASSTESPVWFRFPVGALFAELRRQGFGIGVDTMETALYVIMKAIDSGDEERLDLWLCPVLARSSEEQATFREVYRRLFITALEAPEGLDAFAEKPELKAVQDKTGEERQSSSFNQNKNATEGARSLSSEPADRSRMVVASLKERLSGADVLDRFVRTTEMAGDPMLLRVVRQLRYTRESGRRVFDIRETIRRASRSSGFAMPVYFPHRQHVEYLMLIDRHNHRDHRAYLHNSLYDTLKENNIFVERFWFDNSPLVCRNNSHPGGIAIGELLSLYGHAVLILFADGLQFIDTRQLQLFSWTSVFRHWNHRFLISSVPPALWGHREMLLRELFPVLLPLSTEGLRLLADDLDETDGGECDWVRYWREGADYSLVPLRIEGKRLEEISLFFTSPIKRWIAACAVYPELDWNLTLALGKHLSEAEEYPLNTWRNVSRLLRIDWFIKGRIPRDFRLQLITSWLDRAEVGAVCRFLLNQLAGSMPLRGEHGYADAALQLAVYDLLGEQDPNLKQEKAQRLHGLIEHERHLPDIVSLYYASIDEITPLDFEIPEHLLEGLGLDIAALKQILPQLPENFVRIPEDEFTMGSPEDEPERDASDETQHQVKVSEFAICRYAVTVKEYLLFVEETDSHYPEWMEKGSSYNIETGSEDHYKKLGEALTGEQYPIVGVSWNDAEAYCKWLSEKTGKKFRLPTEAEWEYACRAGTAAPFNTGENLTTEQANYDGNYPYNNTQKGVYRGSAVPVDEFAPNAWGLYNMHGNVYEWCRDWYDSNYYEACRAKGVVENPDNQEKSSGRVLRGGSWHSNARYCRSAYRIRVTPGNRRSHVGFRLVFVP